MIGGALVALPRPSRAQIGVEVSDTYQVLQTRQFETRANSILSMPVAVDPLRADDAVELSLTASRPEARLVVDLLPTPGVAGHIAERTRLLGANPDRGRAVAAPLGLRWRIGEAAGHTVVITAEGWTFGSTVIEAQLRVTRRLTAQERAAWTAELRRLATYVDDMFVTRSFTISLRPCGSANAFSYPDSGNIAICTEIVPDLRTSTGAFLGVFFHELGHSLLRLFGLPGWDQENTADDFATYMLLTLPGGPGMAADFAAFFASDDPVAEAFRLVHVGGRHASGLQRIQNIQGRLRDPAGFMDEWNRLLYPRMQTAHLQRIAADPRPYESPRLATATLATR